MRTADGAIAWMRDQHERATTGWRGFCLRASRTAWGLPGGWESANAWWAAVPPEHRHPWSDRPPLGAPVYFAGGSWGHIGLADGAGNLWHTDAPTVDRIGRTVISWPVDRWGFRPVGWASWLNGAVLPLGGTGSIDGDTAEEEGQIMERSEVTRRAAQTVGEAWAWLTLDQEVRDSADLHFRDGILSLGTRRFDLVTGLTITAAAPARVTVQACVVDASNRVQTQYPAQSFEAGPGVLSARSASWSGFCPRDRRIRLRARALDAPASVLPYVTITRW